MLSYIWKNNENKIQEKVVDDRDVIGIITVNHTENGEETQKRYPVFANADGSVEVSTIPYPDDLENGRYCMHSDGKGDTEIIAENFRRAVLNKERESAQGRGKNRVAVKITTEISDLDYDESGDAYSTIEMKFHEGDKVRVAQGRTIPVGTEFTVKYVSTFSTTHGNNVITYVYGTEGEKISAKNVVLVEGAELPPRVGEKAILTRDVVNPTTGVVKHYNGTIITVADIIYDFGKLYYLDALGQKYYGRFMKRYTE